MLNNYFVTNYLVASLRLCASAREKDGERGRNGEGEKRVGETVKWCIGVKVYK
jgi:hypothetical protein